MMARVHGGGDPFSSYRTQDGTRGERACLRPTTQKPKHTHRNKKVDIEIGFHE